MQTLRPGDTYRYGIETRNGSTEALQNIDNATTITVIARRNGTDDAAFSIAAVNVATGLYELVGTVPNGYAKADKVTVRYTATVNGTTDSAWAEGICIDTKLISDLQDPTVTTIANTTKTTMEAGIEVESSVQDTAPTASSFKVSTGLSQGIVGMYCVFRNGTQTAANVGIAQVVNNYNAGTGLLSFSTPWPGVPTNGDPCTFIGRSA